jgi:hypothetical protein
MLLFMYSINFWMLIVGAWTPNTLVSGLTEIWHYCIQEKTRVLSGGIVEYA